MSSYYPNASSAFLARAQFQHYEACLMDTLSSILSCYHFVFDMYNTAGMFLLKASTFPPTVPVAKGIDNHETWGCSHTISIWRMERCLRQRFHACFFGRVDVISISTRYLRCSIVWGEPLFPITINLKLYLVNNSDSYFWLIGFLQTFFEGPFFIKSCGLTSLVNFILDLLTCGVMK